MRKGSDSNLLCVWQVTTLGLRFSSGTGREESSQSRHLRWGMTGKTLVRASLASSLLLNDARFSILDMIFSSYEHVHLLLISCIFLSMCVGFPRIMCKRQIQYNREILCSVEICITGEVAKTSDTSPLWALILRRSGRHPQKLHHHDYCSRVQTSASLFI